MIPGLQSDLRPFWVACLDLDDARGFAALNGVSAGSLRVIRGYSDALAMPHGAKIWVLGTVDHDIAAGLDLAKVSRAAKVRYADIDELVKHV